jgi:hypothetical protein
VSISQDVLALAQASWNAGDLDGYLELYDEGIRLHGYAPEPMDRAEVRTFYQAVFAAFDAPQLESHEVLWDGAACTIRFTMTGRHGGEFMGVPATGTTSRSPGSRSCTSPATASSSASRRPTCWACSCGWGRFRRRPELAAARQAVGRAGRRLVRIAGRRLVRTAGAQGGPPYRS